MELAITLLAAWGFWAMMRYPVIRRDLRAGRIVERCCA
jgi:hypothetical protein